MGGPASAYEPMPVAPGAVAEMPKIGGFAGFFDAIGAGKRAADSGPDWGLNQRNYEARALSDIEQEAAKRGWRPRQRVNAPDAQGMYLNGPVTGLSVAQARDAQIDDLLQFVGSERARDPKFLPHYAEIGDRKQLGDWAANQRHADYERADTELARYSGPARFLGGTIVGGFGHALTDPVTYLPLPGAAGGNASLSLGRQLLQSGLKVGAVNAGLTLALEPAIDADAARIDVPHGFVEGAEEVGGAGLLGVVLGGAAKGAKIGLRGLYDRVAPPASGAEAYRWWDVLGVDAGASAADIDAAFRAKARTAHPDAGGSHAAMAELNRARDAARAAATQRETRARAGTAGDREAVEQFRLTVPEGNWTPDERAAVNTIERTSDVAEASPYHADGDKAHLDSFGTALDAIVRDGAPHDAPAPVPPPSPRAMGSAGHFGHILAIEGGTNADGSFRTSPKGAIGPAQVMPGTAPEAARLAGLPYDEHRYRTDPDYNRALGEAYYADLQRQFGGDPVKAAAAYNAGPGNAAKGTGLRGAMARAAAAGEPDGWARYLPHETQKYVENFMARSGSEPSPVTAIATSEGAAEALPGMEVPQIRDDVLDVGRDGVMAGWLTGEAGMPVMHTGRFAPHEIGVDAELMQFKAGGDSAGVTERLNGVSHWNDAFAGQVMVWEGADGRRLIADGHQRLGLARRIAEADPAQDIRLAAIVMREADGISARDARVIAAMKNHAEGSGSAIDAAKVVRDAGDGVLKALPPRSALVRDARPLAALGDDAWGLVINDLVRPDYAAIVGRLVPEDHGQQLALTHLLMQTEPANAMQAEAIVRQGIAAGFDGGTQIDMFGEGGGVASRFLQRAKVLDKGLQRLRRLKLVYNTAASEAGALSEVGSSIAVEASAREAQANAQAIELVSRLAHSAGPVATALDDATGVLVGGGKLGDAIGRFVDAVRKLDLDAVARESGDAGGPGAHGDGIGSAGHADGAASGLAEGAAPELIEAVAAAEAERDLSAGLFDDPATGEGAKAQVESIEHDLRMEAGAADPRISAVAKRFGLTEAEAQDLITTAVDELRRRDKYLPPSNTTTPTTDFEKMPLGSSKLGLNSDPQESYIEVLRDFDPRTLISTEPEDGIRATPIYQSYVDWARQGIEPPPITVFEGSAGRFNTSSRRRSLAAQEAGSKQIKGWLSLDNPETGLPLKYRDVLRAYEDTATDPNISARQTQETQLAAASPLRAQAEQDGTMGLAMFDHSDQPHFALDDGDQRSLGEIMQALDAEEAENAAIRDCLAPRGTGGEA